MQLNEMANDRKPEPEAGSRFGVAGVCLSKTIEDVLDELLAGKISRDEAAAQIRDMTGIQSSRGV